MGGSGGGGFFFESSIPPEDISKKIRNEEKRSTSDAYETEVAGMMRQLLSNVNNRDVETIQTHLSTIENALHSEIDGFIDLKYAGSVSKHTYVDGLSDIDSLAILNKSELVNQNPVEVKKYFYKMLTKRLPNTEISIGHLCVTVKFSSGVEIQILPTLKDKNGIKIPSSRRENAWSHVHQPRKFALALRYSNIKMSGKLVPVIKLAKSVISSFSESRRLSGYHVEALSIETFNKYTGPRNPRAMLKHFFSEGAKNVLTPIKDKSGQSIHVDDYLGSANSINRKMVSDSMSAIARKMQNADGGSDIRIWEQILK
ncbi:MAG: CBASS oligonucleotide cyclase [Ignavibacteriaceae bacterium]